MVSSKTRKPVTAADYLTKKYISGHLDRELILCEEAENARISEAVLMMREEAGLTQSQLANLIGTQKSAISRLEDADYQGHSLGMLKRITQVLGYRLDLRFEKLKPSPAASHTITVGPGAHKRGLTLQAAKVGKVAAENRPSKPR